MHYKVKDLPSNLSKTELVDLAMFCDKYDVSAVVAPFVVIKNWLGRHKCGGQHRELSNEAQHWELSNEAQDWLFVAYVFDMEEDREYILNMLVINVRVHENEKEKEPYLFYVSDEKRKVNVRASLPDVLLKRVKFSSDDALITK
ncbi:hypothetical protein CC80DRAFT_509153 [Byssothecium circinans]|uniref:Uncharacterized protein n=1 Tax=Byssothecium circinans TaxID=147558 RepID=A0A6A5TFA6_9PLEO|nr:hypothetical protein CC80DRAFT_509153 [Byssothecium circinans]